MHISVSTIGHRFAQLLMTESGVIYYNTTATAPTCTADDNRTKTTQSSDRLHQIFCFANRSASFFLAWYAFSRDSLPTAAEV